MLAEQFNIYLCILKPSFYDTKIIPLSHKSKLYYLCVIKRTFKEIVCVELLVQTIIIYRCEGV